MALNPVYFFFQTSPGFAPVFLRAGLASVFLFHGGQKALGWFGGKGFAESLELMTDASTFGIPEALAVAAIVAELAIVPMLIFGFLTRLGALAGAAVAVGALIYVHRGAPFAEMELPLLVLSCCLALMILGGGRFSLDRSFSRNFLPEVGSLVYNRI